MPISTSFIEFKQEMRNLWDLLHLPNKGASFWVMAVVVGCGDGFVLQGEFVVIPYDNTNIIIIISLSQNYLSYH